MTSLSRRLSVLCLTAGLAACSPALPVTTPSATPPSGPGLPPVSVPPTTITWGGSPATGSNPLPVPGSSSSPVPGSRPSPTPSGSPSPSQMPAPTFADDFVLTTPAGWQLTAKDQPGSGYTTRLIVAAEPGQRGAGEASVFLFGGIDAALDNTALVEQLRNFASGVEGATVGAARKLNRGEVGGFSYTLPDNLQGQGYGWKKGDTLYFLSVVGDPGRLSESQATTIATSFALK